MFAYYLQVIALVLLAGLIGLLLGWLLRKWLCRGNKPSPNPRSQTSHSAQSANSQHVTPASVPNQNVVTSPSKPIEPEKVPENRSKIEVEKPELATGTVGAMPLVEPAEDAPADDLKRISGIGKVLEAKLHEMGITRYAQIAAWSQQDVDKINETLFFSGRIERDNWIDQAQKFLDGKETNFSKRVDKGDVTYE